jgi:hypothetical protein
MTVIRYQTDRKLWLWVATVLFASTWFIPFFELKGGILFRPIYLLYGLVIGIFKDEISVSEFFDIGRAILLFALLSATVSIVAAWLAQCAVVIVRSKKAAPAS